GLAPPRGPYGGNAMITRRDLLWTGVAVGGAAALVRKAGAQHEHHVHPAAASAPASQPASAPRPVPPGWRSEGTVVTPNGARMPWKIVDGAKVFHIVAEPVTHEIVSGLTVEAWGYNGRT